MTQLTTRQFEQYRQDGIVLIEQAFDHTWVERITRAIDRILVSGISSAPPIGSQDSLRVDHTSTGGTMILNLVGHAPEVIDWIEHSPAAELAARICGSSRVRFWQDATFVKAGTEADGGTPWHNDYSTWPFWGEQLPILWMALSDVTVDDAPLITLRGSHTDPHRYYSWMSPPGLPTTEQYHDWSELLAKATAPGAEHQVWTVKAGDCLLMHPKIIHSSAPRKATAPGRRISFSTRWLGDDAIWAPDAYTFLPAPLAAHPSMRHGAAPPDELFPVVWRDDAVATR